MFNRLLVLALVALFTLNLQAQKIQNLELPSDGKIVLSEKTDTAKTYIITVEGTYSMWPREGSSECYGVDAGYVYDVPKAEVDALRWLPEFIEIAGQKIPILPLPQYVGDPTEYQIPPKQLGSPFFELSFRKYVGFRIDGEPLPNKGFNNLTHSYQIEKKGTGLPFSFQILDTNYSIIQEKTIPRYDDNCGVLKISIAEKSKEIELCDLGAICEDSLIVGIRVSSRILADDTTSITGKKNLLQNIDKSRIGLVENGKFKCDIDTIICNQNDGLAMGFIIDQSGSMRGPISDQDPQSERMASSKTAFKLLANNLGDKDSVFIMGFENKVNLVKDWSNSKSEIIESIDGINYIEKAQTSFYEAIIQGLDKISQTANPNRYLVVLSDGGNTILNGQTADFEKIPDSLFKIIASKSVNIPIYIIALGFTTVDYDEGIGYIDSVGRMDIRNIANVSNGRDIDVYSSSKLDSVMQSLKLDITSNDCCEIIFDIEKCKKGEVKTIRLIYSPDDSTFLTKAIKFNCDCEEKGGITFVEDEEIQSVEKIELYPNPSNSTSTIQYNMSKPGSVQIKVMDLLGNTIKEFSQNNSMPGVFYYDFETSNLNEGSYLVQVKFENTIITSKLIIMR